MGAEAKTNGDEIHELAAETKQTEMLTRAANDKRDHEDYATEVKVKKEKQIITTAANEALKKAEELTADRAAEEKAAADRQAQEDATRHSLEEETTTRAEEAKRRWQLALTAQQKNAKDTQKSPE